ncbi:molybdopterin cofactor-binding domain-containing protein [Pseudoroseomonas wenyumeiae]
MDGLTPTLFADAALPEGQPVNLSRRGMLGATLGAFVLGVALPPRAARAQAAAPKVTPGSRVPAFLEIRADGSVLLKSPFIEGGQGIDTALAQIVGEELDVDPARFVVECAPPARITRWSMAAASPAAASRPAAAIR